MTEYWPVCATPAGGDRAEGERAGAAEDRPPGEAPLSRSPLPTMFGVATQMPALQKAPGTHALSAVQLVPHAPVAQQETVAAQGRVRHAGAGPVADARRDDGGVGGVACGRRVAHQAGGVDAASSRAVADAGGAARRHRLWRALVARIVAVAGRHAPALVVAPSHVMHVPVHA